MPPIRIVFVLAFGTALFWFRLPDQSRRRNRGPSVKREIQGTRSAQCLVPRAVDRDRTPLDQRLGPSGGQGGAGSEAEAAYRQLFNWRLHITSAPRRCRRPNTTSHCPGPPIKTFAPLANLVQILARAEKGDHNQSLADLGKLFKHPPASGGPPHVCDGDGTRGGRSLSPATDSYRPLRRRPQAVCN